ncbi:VOC family protein [Bradyrhizobium prioriisuperbiae]|uniref:VOC family protein n=1 Tax=Bradyrhizobium prioriisuperbiae TaxID=2854389 RepID=UPI0028E54E65|nr:VOC family protein [Bradyrhizobium prioritasuperba]
MTTQPALQPVTAHLSIRGAADAIEFYKKALGATELFRAPAEDGKRLMHAEISVNGMKIYLMDHFPEHGTCGGGSVRLAPPPELKGTSIVLHLEVPNCDEAVKRAADAGATIAMEPWDSFWGARYGQVVDPFGHVWSFAHPLPAKTA